MNHFLRQFAVLMVSGCCVLSVHAQEPGAKLGFVSTDRVLKEANTAMTAQTKLEQEFSKRQKDLAEQQSSLKS